MTAEVERAPRPAAPAQPGGIATAVLVATAAADGGGPAAALPWEDGTVLDRLLGQMSEIGIESIHVITRPDFEEAVRPCAERGSAEFHVCPDAASDVAQVAEIARAAPGGLVLAQADVVTHRAAIEGLLASPGVATGVLSTAGAAGGPFAFRGRLARGRLVSASSAYHAVSAPRMSFLGVLKVAATDRDALIAVGDELAGLMADGLPDGWERELQQKGEHWRLALGRAALKAERRSARDALEAAGRSRDELEPMEPEEYARRRRDLARSLPPDDETEYRLRYEAAKEDSVSLLLVGLVRRGVHMGNNFVRGFFWARPLSRRGIDQATHDIQDYDEDQVLLKSAVKGADGFFTTFFVSTWSRYIARWAARRGFTPNQVTVFSLCVGIVAAGAFATGDRTGYVVGAVLLYLSFVFDCVDGQLARYTRRFSKFGAYLDSLFDRSKEYIAFAGLGIGAGSSEVWILAAAALGLQTFRHSFDFSYGATDRQAIAGTPQPPVAQAPDEALARSRMKSRGTMEPRLGALEDKAATAAELREAVEDESGDKGAAPDHPRSLPRRILGLWRVLDRIPGLVWVKKMAAFPIGERFAVICATAALTTPRTTFVVLLAWGGFALVYTSSGRLLRTLAQWRALPR